MRLLLVEDDVMLASGIKLGLCGAGYAVDWVGSGERAEEVLRTERFDAAVIDIGLPGMDGLELTHRLRRDAHTLPVLILTARDALQDRVQGLDLGADDYMVKPFELPELLARLRALLRRSQAASSSVLSFGLLELDTALRRGSIDGQPLDLGPRECTVLQYLLLAGLQRLSGLPLCRQRRAAAGRAAAAHGAADGRFDRRARPRPRHADAAARPAGLGIPARAPRLRGLQRHLGRRSPAYGEDWIDAMRPRTREPEFFSREHDGVVYRIVAQRVQMPAGELVMQLADGSDPPRQWSRSLLLRTLLPNLVLLVLAALAMHLAVQHALRPLTEAVQHRSPCDLSPLDARASLEEVRLLVQALNRLFGLVNVQSESQRRFVADAAHQLRTPLAGLQAQVEAWAQAAIRQESESKVPAAGVPRRPGAMLLEANDVYELRDATRRTSQLAHQLLALSRADAHALQGQEPAPVDLKALCESMLETHLDAASARGIDLGLEVVPARTLGHAWLLREMLGNLVDNAVKYARAYGIVTIRCGPAHGGGARLEVEDDGPGVAPDERPRVLSRFYRSPGAQGEGSGLGLAIADEIARLHGGRLRLLAGGEGLGLRVEVLLPAEPPAAGAANAAATSP